MSNELALVPQSTSELLAMSESLSNSDFVPVAMQGKPQDVYACIAFGLEVGLKPMQALQNVAVINGRPTLWGDAVLALVMGSSVYKSIKETYDSKTMTSTCIAERKDGTINTQTFSAEDAKAAGLWGKKGPWSQYPMRMLKMRARGFCLRDTFPDILAGIITTEEARDYPDDEIATAEVIIPTQERIDNAVSMAELMSVYLSISKSEKEEYSASFSAKKDQLTHG